MVSKYIGFRAFTKYNQYWMDLDESRNVELNFKKTVNVSMVTSSM